MAYVLPAWKASTLLRVASILTLLYCAGHSAGMPWTPAEGLGEMAVLELMKSYHFEIEGFSRSYWDFYVGFGTLISGFLLLQAVVLWQLAGLAKTDALRVRPVVATFAVAFLLNAALAWIYFFVVPLVMAIAIAATLGLAFVAAGRGEMPPSA